MSRNGSGIYSLPAGSTVTNGDTSDAQDINSPLADLEADMNIPRPVVAGGTGASSAAAALVNLGLTATAAELNKMDGVTATTAEINHLVGATSAIQAQLNAKQAAGATLASLEGLSLVAGDVLYATAADTLARLPKGTAGQALVMNAGATAPEWAGPGYTWPSVITNGAAVYDFGSIPSWASDIVCTFQSVSLATKTDTTFIQVGTGGSPAVTGYSMNVGSIVNAATSVVTSPSTGFLIGSSADDMTGALRLLRRSGSNDWVAAGTVRRSGTGPVASINSHAGFISLGGPLDIVRLIRSGVGNYDAGVFAVGYK